MGLSLAFEMTMSNGAPIVPREPAQLPGPPSPVPRKRQASFRFVRGRQTLFAFDLIPIPRLRNRTAASLPVSARPILIEAHSSLRSERVGPHGCGPALGAASRAGSPDGRSLRRPSAISMQTVQSVYTRYAHYIQSGRDCQPICDVFLKPSAHRLRPCRLLRRRFAPLRTASHRFAPLRIAPLASRWPRSSLRAVTSVPALRSVLAMCCRGCHAFELGFLIKRRIHGARMRKNVCHNRRVCN